MKNVKEPAGGPFPAFFPHLFLNDAGDAAAAEAIPMAARISGTFRYGCGMMQDGVALIWDIWRTICCWNWITLD